MSAGAFIKTSRGWKWSGASKPSASASKPTPTPTKKAKSVPTQPTITLAEIRKRIEKQEKEAGIKPDPSLTLEERLEQLERATKKTPAGGSNRSGEGARIDQAMGLAPKTGIVTHEGTSTVLRATKRRDAQAECQRRGIDPAAHLEASRIKYGTVH